MFGIMRKLLSPSKASIVFVLMKESRSGLSLRDVAKILAKTSPDSTSFIITGLVSLSGIFSVSFEHETHTARIPKIQHE